MQRPFNIALADSTQGNRCTHDDLGDDVMLKTSEVLDKVAYSQTDTSIDIATAPYAALVLRTSLGTLFIAHSLVKFFVFTLSGTAAYFQSLGLPGAAAYVVAPMELVGGLLLILGIQSRWVALTLLPILLMATIFAHGGKGWLFTNQGGGWEFPALFAVGTLVQALLGDGAFALYPGRKPH
jgi:putative oxidoreductase